MSFNRKTGFYAKTWYIFVAAFLFTSLSALCGIAGPLFLFDIVKPADGRPGQDAGIALTLMFVPMTLVALLMWFNIYARSKPLLRICSEGLEINVIGASSLDGVPFVPGVIRVIWLILSRQGFRTQIGWIPWSTFRSVEVKGPPLVQKLIIDAKIVYPNLNQNDDLEVRIGERVEFRDAEFRCGLDSVAATILAFFDNVESRSQLPSLYD